METDFQFYQFRSILNKNKNLLTPKDIVGSYNRYVFLKVSLDQKRYKQVSSDLKSLK